MTGRMPSACERRGGAWRAWLPAFLWAALIFFVSSRPSVPLPPVGHADKLAHFGAYAVLGLLLAWAQQRARVLSPAWMVLVGVLYGASDEIHQSFVPGRYAEFGDWVADALGVVFGVGAYRLWLRRRGARAADARGLTPRPNDD